MVSPVEVARRQLTLLTHHVYSLPVLVLMPHSRCNCRCVMCDIWRANRERREISREALARHLEPMRSLRVEWVVLSGGEALMHSNLWSLCALLREIPTRITLLSTGLLLRRHAADVVRRCDDVIVSLDGPPEIHDAIRDVPRAFERLADGVAALRAQALDFRVTGRCVVQRRNFRHLAATIDAAQGAGLDQISFLAVDVSTTAFNRPQPWSDERVSDVALAPEEATDFAGVVEQTIRSHAADFSSGFVAESPEKLRRLPRYFAALAGLSEFPETVCNAPWVSAVVEADGDVRPCFFHPAYENLRDAPLDRILNSKEARAFRRHLDVRTDPICSRCVCTLHLRPTARVTPHGDGTSR
jgi:Fe-coproporphyrin III synthase